MMSSPDDGTSVAAAGARPRHFPPHRDKRGTSADRGGWSAAAGSSSPTLSGSRASLNSNRDSGYVPSPAGAVRFELDTGDAEDWLPSVPPPRRPVTQPISIPGRPVGLPPPEESALLRRRLRLADRCPPPASSSEEEDEGQEDGPEDTEDRREDGEEDRDEVDQAEVDRQVALLYRETRSLQVGWRDGAVIPPGFTVRAELPDVVPTRPAPEDLTFSGAAGAPVGGGGAAVAAAALVSVSAPAVRRRRPTSRASSASLTVELDVGQELREIADSLPLSRSAPGALLPRRDIWTLIRRSLDFGIRREMAPRPRRNSGRQ